MTDSHQDLPDLYQPVIVTMGDGTEFKAQRILIDEDFEVWATVREFEEKCPACWNDGICWAINEAGVPSEKPVSWRHI